MIRRPTSETPALGAPEALIRPTPYASCVGACMLPALLLLLLSGPMPEASALGAPEALIRPMPASGLAAKSGVADRKDVSITVYNSDLGLVREVRTLKLPAGEVSLEFADVPSKIDPTSVMFAGPGVRVLEQNYEYDLLSPSKLMDKYVGKDVELHQTEMVNDSPREKITTARLVANNGQQPIYLIDRQIHLGFPGRVVLPEIPETLRVKPALVYLLRTEDAAKIDAVVTYQTGGLSWQCDYVAVVGRAFDRLDLLTAWVTLNNASGAGYDHAALKLIEGNVHRVPRRSVMVQEKSSDRFPAEAIAQMAEEPPGMAEKSFAEYHLYTLDRRTSLPENSSKQVELMTSVDIPIKKIFALEPRDVSNWLWSRRQEEQPESVRLMVEFVNDAASHLGNPMPAGRVRINKEDSDGGLVFVGEDAVDHTPANETVRIHLGDATDVVAERRQTDFQLVKSERPRVVESEFEIEIRNRKSEDIELIVTERFDSCREITMLKNSHPWTKKSAHRYEFAVRVLAGETQKLAYRIKAEF